MTKNDKKDYNKIEAKDNMKVDNNQEETMEVRETPEKIKPILSEAPKKRKKGLMERLVVGFLGPDGLPGIGAYLNEEIILPSLKNILVDSVVSGINMAVFGERGASSGFGRPTQSTGNYGYKPERDYSTRTSRYTSRQPAPTRRDVSRVEPIRASRYGVDDYPIPSRQDANYVLTALTEHADKYDAVSVADYYDMITVPSVHTDHNYGWTFDNILKATVAPIRGGGGYSINFPPVEVI